MTDTNADTDPRYRSRSRSRAARDNDAPPPLPPRVLVVAGSDSSGGAGVQADIKAVAALGGHAMTAVSALTVQDTGAVHRVIPVPPDAVLAQMRVCLADLGADAVKTGMLGSRALVEQVAEALDAAGLPAVIDPVMVATSGGRLLDPGAEAAVRAELVPQAALLTPNGPEASVLTGLDVEEVNGQRRAAERLLEAGARAVLVKGGDLGGGTVTDVLQTQLGEEIFEGPRIKGGPFHGTGCTLASAAAARIAAGAGVLDAVAEARLYVRRCLEASPALGKGARPVFQALTRPDAEESGR